MCRQLLKPHLDRECRGASFVCVDEKRSADSLVSVRLHSRRLFMLKQYLEGNNETVVYGIKKKEKRYNIFLLSCDSYYIYRIKYVYLKPYVYYGYLNNILWIP